MKHKIRPGSKISNKAKAQCHGLWTQKEFELLCEGIRQFSNNWYKVSEFTGGKRSLNACSKKYRSHKEEIDKKLGINDIREICKPV